PVAVSRSRRLTWPSAGLLALCLSLSLSLSVARSSSVPYPLAAMNEPEAPTLFVADVPYVLRAEDGRVGGAAGLTPGAAVRADCVSDTTFRSRISLRSSRPARASWPRA